MAEGTVIAPGEIVPRKTTGVNICKPTGGAYLYDRSSNPRKKGLVLINSVGVIDGDYYGNPGNEAHIFAQMKKHYGPRSDSRSWGTWFRLSFAPFLDCRWEIEADGVFGPVDLGQ